MGRVRAKVRAKVRVKVRVDDLGLSELRHGASGREKALGIIAVAIRFFAPCRRCTL